MKVYLFQAALLCESCGNETKKSLAKPEGYDPEDEYTWDSDDYPKGPYTDGGGEADGPQHCDHCGTFLENPLTGDGENYVRKTLAAGEGDADVLAEWRAFYDYIGEDDAEG